MNIEEAMAFYETTPVDMAIIGGGPAGLSAAINGRTRGLSVAIISTDYENSPLFRAAIVDNMPGLPGKSGAELLALYADHAAQMGALTFKGTVLLIQPADMGTKESGPQPIFQIAYGNHFMMSKAVILAMGVASAKPYAGEDKYLGRGVSYCATCDGMLYRERQIAVIAKAKDGIEEAIHLQKIGCHVNLFVNPADLTRWGINLDAKIFEKVEHSRTFAIEGDEVVRTLITDQGPLQVDGVFILRSTIAPTTLLSGLELSGNFITADKAQATNIPGVFAAGDCTGKPLQIAKALGEGLVAALSADSYLSKLGK